MEITTNPQILTASDRSTTQLADNFETFLTLLTTQLQNQDPLEPLDSNEFTEQLVQFSSVEQAIQTNTNLENLVAINQAATAGTAVSYLGKFVTALGDQASLQNGQAQWSYDLPVSADQTSLVVLDATGKLVYTAQGQTNSGKHDFVWDGNDNAGNPLPDGSYTLQVSSLTEDGDPLSVTTSAKGLVDGVEFDGTQPFLTIGSSRYTLTDILTLEEFTSGN